MTRIDTHKSHEVIDDMEVQRRVEKNIKDAPQLRSEYLAEMMQYVPFGYQGMARTIVKLIDKYSKTSSGPFNFWRSV